MSEFDYDRSHELGRAISERDQCDVVLYNGEIERISDLHFIEKIHLQKRHDKIRLILTTGGGDPDAAYKMARYIQEKYDRIEILVSGLCKSAGTLIVIGAHQIVLSPYGELGPLDVQVAKEDKLSGLNSGLNISEALLTLEKRAATAYMNLIGDIIQSSSGVVTFQTASAAASAVLTGLYAPIFAQFDPEDLGGRARSMRIASKYGERLDSAVQNLKPKALDRLAETYPSHGFVIDRTEAASLFKNVRPADALELELVHALGHCSRYPLPGLKGKPLILCLSEPETSDDGIETDAEGAGERDPEPDGSHLEGAGDDTGATASPSRDGGSLTGRPVDPGD